MSRSELDSHADTCVAGSNTLLLHETGRTVNVVPFSDEVGRVKNIPIACVATLWQDLTTGHEYILILHEVLYFGDRMESTLLNPNQLRHGGAIVEDTPRQFNRQSKHAIIFPLGDKGEQVTIPLEMDGVISGFESRKR